MKLIDSLLALLVLSIVAAAVFGELAAGSGAFRFHIELITKLFTAE